MFILGIMHVYVHCTCYPILMLIIDTVEKGRYTLLIKVMLTLIRLLMLGSGESDPPHWLGILPDLKHCCFSLFVIGIVVHSVDTYQL